MVSGGADSACAAAGARRTCSAPSDVHALHVNYGLRDGRRRRTSAACRDLCAALRIDLHVERPELAGRQPPGRRARGPLHGRRAAARADGGRLIATGHTRTDVAETVALPARRLARAPRRCSGCAPRSGRVVRPLLGLERERARASSPPPPACRSPTTRPTTIRPSPATGSAPRCCRCCASSAPPPSATSPRPAPSSPRRRRCSSASCSRRSRRRRRRCRRGRDPGRRRSPAAEPALRRLALRALAERAAGRPVRARPAARRRDRAPGRAARGRRGRARRRPARVCESGLVRLRDRLRARRRARAGRAARSPGSAGSGDWEVRAELHPAPVDAGGPRPRDPRRRRARRARSRSAPGARATACGRSAWTAPRRSGTCSPTAACRARCAPRCPVVTSAARSPGSPGSPSPSDFRLDADDRAVAYARAVDHAPALVGTSH